MKKISLFICTFSFAFCLSATAQDKSSQTPSSDKVSELNETKSGQVVVSETNIRSEGNRSAASTDQVDKAVLQNGRTSVKPVRTQEMLDRKKVEPKMSDPQ